MYDTTLARDFSLIERYKFAHVVCLINAHRLQIGLVLLRD